MHALDHGVDGSHGLKTRRRPEHGAIVADAGDEVVGLRPVSDKKLLNEAEFVHGFNRLQAAFDFDLPELLRRLVEAGVDVLVTIQRAETLRQVNAFIDDNAVGDIDP